mgnify:CR=1 FL=1
MSEGDIDIADTIAQLEEIAETLGEGDVGLTAAKELREEADTHLEALRSAIDVGDGDIIEIDERQGQTNIED